MPAMLTFPPQGIWTVILTPENGSDNGTAPKVKFSLLPMTTDRSNDGDDLSSSPFAALPKKTTLNPNAKVFQSPKLSNSVTSSADSTDSSPDWHDNENRSSQASSPQTPMTTQGPYQMNGDVGKFSGLGYPPSPESPAFSLQNGYIGAPEYPYLPDGQLVTSDDLSMQELPKGEDLRKLLQRQLEYYFSRENLANDRYLQSQMDADQYVPISTIANFNAVKKLTKDMPLIVDVLRESPCVKVDDKGEMVRPNHKRCTVILREVSQATPVEEVKELFSGQNCPKFVSCEFAHNSNWYITFESDSDAQKAYRYLREEVGSFQGKPIMARIKAKPLQRINFSPKPAPVNGYTSTGQQIFAQQFQYPPTQHLNSISQQPPPQQQTTQQQQSSQAQQFAFYSTGVGPSQQWGVTSPTYFEPPPMQQPQAFSPGAFPPPPPPPLPPQNKYQPMNVNRQHAYQGPRSRPHPKSHLRTSSTPELRTTDRISGSAMFTDNSIQRSQSDRRTSGPPVVVSPRGSVFDTPLRDRDEGLERRNDEDRRRDDKEREQERDATYGRRRDPAMQSATTPPSSSANARGRYQEEPITSSSSSLQHNARSPRATSYRDRRPRRREDEIQNRRNSRDVRDSRDKDTPTSTPKEPPKAPSPQIDLASFPPLPGRIVSELEASDSKKDDETNNNDLVTPMADIVKGVKDPKRAAKSQETSKPSPPATKDTATNTNSTDDSREPVSPSIASQTPTSIPSKQTLIPVATQTDLDVPSSPEPKPAPHAAAQHPHPKVSQTASQTASTRVNTKVTVATSTAAAIVARTMVPTATGSTQTRETGSPRPESPTTTNSSSASCPVTTTTTKQATESPVPRLSYAAAIARKPTRPATVSNAAATSTATSTTSTPSTNSESSSHGRKSPPLQTQHQSQQQHQTHPRSYGPPKTNMRPRYGFRNSGGGGFNNNNNDRDYNYEPRWRRDREYYPGRRTPPPPSPHLRQMNSK